MKNRITRAWRSDLPWLSGGAEIRFCAMLIGIIELLWSLLGILPPEERSLFAVRLYDAGLDVEWFGVMGGVGLVTVAGAILPWRSGRHIGLALSCLIWVVMTGVFLDLVFRSPVVMSMPVFAIFSIGMMYADAKRKPREKLVT